MASSHGRRFGDGRFVRMNLSTPIQRWRDSGASATHRRRIGDASATHRRRIGDASATLQRRSGSARSTITPC
jgi:hypothetical protein